MNRNELTSQIARDRAALDAVVDSLDDERLTTPGHEGWSVKDHLSHIAAWERMIVAHLRNCTDHEVVGMDEAAYARASLQELNDRLYELHRDEPAGVLRAEYRAAHLAIVACIRQLPEERFAEVYWPDDPSRKTVLDKIAGDTYLHYREHLEWIRELLARLEAR
jgi:hypothetical protein